MAISRADVEKVALLSRLRLSESELDTMTAQLAQIVQYVDHLSEVDTEGVSPMAHAIEVQNVFRADQVTASLPRDEYDVEFCDVVSECNDDSLITAI